MDECAADGEHLLFAATEVLSSTRAEVVEPREDLVDVFDRSRVYRRFGRDLEVLADGQGREDSTLLGNQLDTALADLVDRESGDVLAPEGNLPFTTGDGPGDASERGRLAGAIPAEEGNNLVLLDDQVQVEENVAVSVEGVDVRELEDRHQAPAPR